MNNKKDNPGLGSGHYVIASIVGILSGFLLQGSEFPFKAGASFSVKAFIGYTLLSTVGVLIFMRINKTRE